MSIPTLPAPIFPPPEATLDEVAAGCPQDTAAALVFALWRAVGEPSGDRRPVLIAIPRWSLGERGRPFGRGLAEQGLFPERLLLVRAADEVQALWALEEALKSGAVSGAVGLIERPSFVATRRLVFAAQAGAARAILLRSRDAGGLSAARRRWRVSARPSRGDPFDARAPGPTRLMAEWTNRHDGPPVGWLMEQDDATGRLRLAEGLADHGLVPPRRTGTSH